MSPEQPGGPIALVLDVCEMPHQVALVNRKLTVLLRELGQQNWALSSLHSERPTQKTPRRILAAEGSNKKPSARGARRPVPESMPCPFRGSATPWRTTYRWTPAVRIVAALSEGNGVRGTARMTKTGKNTVHRARPADRRRLPRACMTGSCAGSAPSRIIQGDETWSFVFKKEARVDPTKDPAEWGDAYTFIGLNAVARLVVSYHVGKRDAENADIFARDLRSRLTMVPHLATDRLPRVPRRHRHALRGRRRLRRRNQALQERCPARAGPPLRAAARPLRHEAHRPRGRRGRT